MDPAAGAAPGAPAPPRITAPRLLSASGAEYPPDGFRLTLRRSDLGSSLVMDGAQGTVGLRALVRSDGSVADVAVTVSSGSDVLDRAAAEAVRGWRFAPALKDGTPFDAFVALRIRYVVR